MTGATGAAVTVKVAVALVMLPAEFETTTENFAPLSARAAEGVV